MKPHDLPAEEIAIVGMACALPGAADTLEGFRSTVMDGREETGPMPADRFGDDMAATPAHARHGGFLARSPWAFDPAVFSIAPKEAASMDPQHRLLLETCYHAIEDAGIDPSSLRKRRWGVFVGLSTLDFARRMASSGDYDGFLSRGALGSMAAGRIAYHFGLEGPALVVDTACSSSLVAVHQALGALAAGECEAAIVAGASLMLTHDYSVDLARAGMLAADGRCKPFTKQADGFARGEGTGAVVLMWASIAAGTGRRVYAHLLGSAVNSDGRSNGITAPSQAAQRRVIEAALEKAAMRPDDVSYVETHGTGTDLGDRIELAALADVFGGRRHPLYLGALKANIGHCEGSAGIASLIKAALCTFERRIAPHCMGADIDGDLPFARLGAQLLAEAMPWRPSTPGGRRIAGVSSFGMSGTNAHVLVAEAPVRGLAPAPGLRPGPDSAQLLFLSARTPASLTALAEAYANAIAASSSLDGAAWCAAALAQRQVWPHAAIAVVGRGRDELVARLRERQAQATVTAPLRRVAIVFAGRAGAPAGTARALVEASPRFGALLTELCTAADDISGQAAPLRPLILEAAQGARMPAVALLVLQCALARFWTELGCRAEQVLGHDIGATSAACLAGMLDFEAAVRLVLARPDAQGEPADPAAAAAKLVRDGIDAVIEIGPDARFCGLVAEAARAAERTVACLPSLEHGVRGDAALLRAVARLAEGGALDIRKAMEAFAATPFDVPALDLPKYAFDRQLLQPRSWPRAVGAGAARGREPRLALPWQALDQRMTLRLGLEGGPFDWIGEHRIHGRPILPGAFYLSAGVAIAAQGLLQRPEGPRASIRLEDLTVSRPLEFGDGIAAHELECHVRGHVEDGRLAIVCRTPGEAGLELARVHAAVRQGLQPVRQATAPEPGAWESPQAFYDAYARCGVAYGPLFRRIDACRRIDDTSVSCRIAPPDVQPPWPLHHAVFFDACFQALGLCVGRPGSAFAPVAVESMHIDADAAWVSPSICQASLRSSSETVLVGDVLVRDERGAEVAALRGITCVRLPARGAGGEVHFHADWVRQASPAAARAHEPRGETWLLAAPAGDTVPDAWLEALVERGVTVVALALHGDGPAALSRALAGKPSVRSILAWPPAAARLADPTACRAVADVVRGLRQLVGRVCDRQPGQALQVCLATPARADADVLGAAAMQALAVQCRTELPQVDTALLEWRDAARPPVDAIVALRGAQPELAPQGVSTPLWRLDADGLARLELLPGLPGPADARSRAPRREGRYLVTGAFGGVGRQLVEHLVDELGCRRLVLVRRAEPAGTREDQALLAGLRERAGPDIQVLVADLADPGLDADRLRAQAGAVDGIFHLAGAIADRPIAETDAAQLEHVVGAKLRGAAMLHAYARGCPGLEFVVHFSSLAALLESPGQLAYALANAGLQRLAAHDRARGLPVTVVDWGPWVDTGMMRRIGGQAPSRSLRQLRAMAPKAACAALIEAMGRSGGGAHLAICEIAAATPARRPVPPAAGHEARPDPLALLLELVAAETGHAAADLSSASTLEQLGLDSVGTLRIRSELQQRLGLSLPASLFFDDVTLADVLAHLPAPAHAPTPASARAEPVPRDAASPSRHGRAPDRVPLSYNQFAIWYERVRQPESRAYQCAIAWRVAGDRLDAGALASRWHALVAEHELLRATFDEVDGEPGYVVHPAAAAIPRCTVNVEDVGADDAAQARIHQLLEAAPDLSSEFATRVSLLRSSPGACTLVVSSNHLVMDAAAIFHVGVELLQALCGVTPTPRSDAAPYRAFVAEQRAIAPGRLAAAAAFLVDRIVDAQGEPTRLELPLDRVRTPASPQTGGTVRVPLGAPLAARLDALTPGRRAAVPLAAWLLMLARVSGQRRVVTGVAFNGRSAQRWRSTVGHFVNVLPLACEIDERLTIEATVERVRRALFELVDHQDIALPLLMRDERLRASSASAGLFQTYFNFFDASEMAVDAGPRIALEPLDVAQQEAQFDLSLWVTQREDEWAIDLKYADAVFDRATVSQFAQHFAALLDAFAAPEGAAGEVAAITMLSAAQQAQLQSGQGPVARQTPCVDPDADDPPRVHELFEHRAREFPEGIAIEWGTRLLRYRELADMAEAVAQTLRDEGVGAETTVGILFPTFGCPEALVAILAIWKCGAAYVALDVQHPAARTRYMIETARCGLVLTLGRTPAGGAAPTLAGCEGVGVCALALHAGRAAIACELVRRGDPGRRGRLEPNGDYAGRDGLLAYVLFTSGSTGRPKGVLVEHAGLTQRLRWMERHFAFGPGDKFLQGTVLTFDISVPEFSLPLMTGGTVVLMDESDGPTDHTDACTRHGVTMMSTVPSLLHLLLEPLTRCRTLRHVISVGEALMQPVVRAWLESGTPAVLHNLYGPTEATIYATFHACREVPEGPGAPIGVACDGVLCWVLDAFGRPVPPGVPGELVLGGSGVARGYVGDVKSPDAFAVDTARDGATRRYRTGDIVKWRRDGGLDYLGRHDFRLKLRGRLIELGEIEHVLMSHPGVRHATALVVEVGAGTSAGRQIVGCVVAEPFEEAAVQAAAKLRLPEYMLPWRVLRFERLPANGSGKVDRKALAAQVTQALERDADTRRAGGRRAVLSPEQAALCALWETQFDVPAVGTDESFFRLGGDSLSLARMVLAAERELGLKVDFGRFLAEPTIDGFLAACAGARQDPPAAGTRLAPETAQALDLAGIEALPAFRGTAARSPQACLLTGATGHLGAWLLRVLLEETDWDLDVLVRAASDVSARARLESRYRDTGGPPLATERVRILRGDAALPRFGLDADAHARLARRTTHVLHAAAQVNHAADYASLRAGNVAAARHILEFASAAEIGHLHHISTQYTELASLPEHWLEPAEIGQLSSGYERSKFVAEAAMGRAARLGYPASIYRLPLLLDERDPQLERQNHFVAFALKCLSLGAYPDTPIAVPILPTEHVARYIVRRCKLATPAAVRNAFLGAPDFRAIARRLAGGGLRALAAAEWIARARAQTAESEPFFRMLPLYGALEAWAGRGRTVEHAAFADELGRLELPVPADSTAWLVDATVHCLSRLAALRHPSPAP